MSSFFISFLSDFGWLSDLNDFSGVEVGRDGREC